jgi:hypothetical protein
MFIQILSHTPHWVWAILLGIAVLGGLQLQARQMPRWRLIALPLALLALGLSSLWSGFRAHPTTALAWSGALLATGALGWRLAARSGAVWLTVPQRLQLPGSALPLVLGLTIFCLRYANGVATAIQPALVALPLWHDTLALLFGSLSGLFVGRAAGLLALSLKAADVAPEGRRMGLDERHPDALGRHGS